MPPILALPFQQVVGEYGDGRLFQHLGGEVLAADALLQQGKGLYAEAFEGGRRGIDAGQRGGRLLGRMFPDQDFAIDHCAVRQAASQLAQLGKTLADQLLATRPDPDLPVALDQLRADAVPLPFDQPVLRCPEQRVELVHWRLQRVSKKEGIGLTTALGMFVFRFVGDQRQIAFGAGPVGEVGVTHQTLRHPFRVEVGQRGQGTGDQQL